MTIGERMKAARRAAQVSAEELASVVGVSPATIYRYEKGDIEKVPQDVLDRIAAHLGTTSAYLKDALVNDLYALDIVVTSEPDGRVIVKDEDTGRVVSYSAQKWEKLREGNDFKVVLSDLQRASSDQGDSARKVTDEELKFALFGNANIDDAMLDEVKAFAKFTKSQRESRKND